MCALAVFLERAGIATVVIGLTRLHIEKIRPPRALWVPFALGRPLGGVTPDGEFKKEVLRAAFKLLNRTDGPVILEDFPTEDPGTTANPRWQAPDLSAANTIVDEVTSLMPKWERGVERLGRTMVGLSGLSIEVAADYLERFDTNDPADNPGTDQSALLRMRFCADDLCTFMPNQRLPTMHLRATRLASGSGLALLLRKLASDPAGQQGSTRKMCALSSAGG